jgi:hypothetical protein
MNVRHAKLLNEMGEPANFGGFDLVPAAIVLDGTRFIPCFPLSGIRKERIPPILRAPIAKHYDVAWVRGRLPLAFGIAPEPSENEKTFLEVGFVAVPAGEDEGIGFYCSDYYGRTSLTFSPNEKDEDAKRAVAEAFWGYLLSKPDDLEDFKASVLHLGAPVTLHFGCEDGEPFCYETEDAGPS